MRRISCALVILLSASSVYADNPPSGQIVIDIITVNGTGCPAGTAVVSVSPDNTAFTVGYSNYTAQVGIGSRPTDFRKTCNLNLLVHVPSGFVYGIAFARERGFASIAAGATGFARRRVFFQGQTPPPFSQRRFPGPFFGEWEPTDEVAIDLLPPPPCGRQPALNIGTELQVDVGTSDPTTTTSFITTDSADGQSAATYQFHWQRCP